MSDKIIQFQDSDNNNLYPQEYVKQGILTAAEGYTLTQARCVQIGKIVEIHFYAHKDSGTFGTSQQTLARVSGVSLPPKHIRFLAGTGVGGAYLVKASAYCILGASTGAISLNSATGTHDFATVDLVYTID